MIYYAPTIFGQLGLDGNTTSLLATGVYGIVNCLSTLPALFFIDKVGRRPLLMAGAAGTCISLVIVGGILGGFGSSLVSNKSAGWAGIAFIYIYDINFSYSFGKIIPKILFPPSFSSNQLTTFSLSAPIGWVLPSEIFNLSIRSKAISITTSATWMCNL
jgi:MFS family permease